MSEYLRRYIKKEHYPNPPCNIKFKTAFRNCVYRAFLAREWKEAESDDWNLMWCQKEQIDWVFEKHRLQPKSKVNHFRGWTELCRKDTLNKNLKKYKRGLEKQGNSKQSNQYDFLPSTFLLPSEYVIFYEEFKRFQHNECRNLWIMKPTAKCQGKGIFIFNKASDISKWKSVSRDSSVDSYVCQRYIINPMLFGGRKFDMRIYALCTSYQPLTIYLYRSGFARFTHQRYDNLDIDNLYKHLTNVAINIHSPNYVKKIGGKWFLDNLKNFMLSKLGIKNTNDAFADVQRAIIKAMKAVEKMISNSHHSFQLYGFDFLFDSEGKAWLLEVNGGPSMTANTPEDAQLKTGLIDDVMTIINVEGVLKGDEQVVGGFDLIYKGKQIGISDTNIYSTMLGCKLFRVQNLKKLARSCAIRLGKEFMQSQTAKIKSQTKKIDQPNKFNLKPKQKSNQISSGISMNSIQVKKKIDNVNTEFIRYIEERKQSIHQTIPKKTQEKEEEQEEL